MTLDPRTHAPATGHGREEMTAPLRRAVFLDRDGVLNRVVRRGDVIGSPRTVEEFILIPEAAALCAALHADGWLLAVVTNQPDVSRGLLDPAVLDAMHARLRAALPLDAIDVCPSGDDADPRRKPNPGMLRDAAARIHIDLGASWILGDSVKDMRAGRAAGVRTLLLATEYNHGARAFADQVADSHARAVEIIRNDTNHRTSR